MKVYFLFNSSETIDGWLKFSMEWDCPYLPRTGDTIEPSIITKKVTPEMFREALTEKSGKQWDEAVSKGTGAESLMKDWLIEMQMKVVDVSWGMDADGLYASFLLEETDSSLG